MPYVTRLTPEKVSDESIATIDNLCLALDITRDELNAAMELPSERRYTRKEIPKRDGSLRFVHNPHYLIRKIQRRINRRIFSNLNLIKWPDYVFGSVPNDPASPSSAPEKSYERDYEKDYVNCARQHCGAKSILSVDVKDFFDNIHIDRVKQIFNDFLKYPSEVANVLADICCKDGHVVQGALTSSYVATLCLFDNEGALVVKLHRKGLVYTRLVDDITISSKTSHANFEYALRQTEQMLNDAELPLNIEKTRIQHSGMSPLIVHGLRVDFKEPRLPPEEPRKIRAAVHNLEQSASSPGYRASRAYRKDFNRCMGRVNKLGRVGHVQHAEMRNKLKRILPLASHADIGKAQQFVERLEHSYKKPGYRDSYWFYRRYYVASERLTVLQRSFPRVAQELRNRLRAIMPDKRHE